jgi:hypothetical protein
MNWNLWRAMNVSHVRDIQLDVWVVLDDVSQVGKSDRMFADLTVTDMEVDL